MIVKPIIKAETAVSESMYRIIINSLSAHIAVVNSQGEIIETNQAWQQFGADNGLPGNTDSIGTNYLAICEAARKSGEEEGGLVAQGMQQVLTGELLEFVHQYPCHAPSGHRWFNLRILPYKSATVERLLVVHEDITPIILAQEKVRRQEEELRRKGEKLTETNIALKILLEQRQRDLEALEQRMAANIREMVLPYVERLKSCCAGRTREQTLAEIVEENLTDIVAPFLNHLSALHLRLTPQEVEVAGLVRHGKSSQQIADALGLALSTISFHRKNLRRKLGLSDHQRNLRSYLLSLR